MWFYIMAIVLTVGFCEWFFWPSYWPKKGVRQAKYRPFFYILFWAFIKKQSMCDMIKEMYKGYPGSRYYGIYQFKTPSLLVKDPDLIKQIMVKDFEHFTDHRTFIPENADPFWSKNLFSLTGQRWRDMRSTLSPAFTSSKMRYMFALIHDCAKQFSQHFTKKNKDLIEVEFKDTFTRFTNDVIATSAFGINCDSLEEPDNEFFQQGREVQKLFSFSVLSLIRILILTFAPRLGEFMKLSFFPKRVSSFFYKLVKENVRTREEKSIIRPDLINLLMVARKQGLKYEENPDLQDAGFATVIESDIGKSGRVKEELTDLTITAQAMLFFLAGFETVSVLMCFLSYELAINPNIQDRLRKEIDETFKTCDGEVTYEDLLKMKYMDMVVSEALRLWPPSVFADRVCTKPYTIPAERPDETPVKLEKGMILWLPIFGLHRDPEHFPEPTRFDPERFSDENKVNIKPCTYMPFGSGPRACIGSRFALLEVKALYFYLLLNFKIVPTAKSTIPVRISSKSFSVTSDDGFWFGLQRR